MTERTMEYELSESTLRLLERRRDAGCFLCRRIVEALDERHVLRDWPVGEDVAVEFPVEAQRYHVKMEKGA